MADTKMISEKEAVRRERKAFVAGANFAWHEARVKKASVLHEITEAERKYKDPAVALGRYAGREYRIIDGVLEYPTRTQTPICGGDAPLEGRWDRATLQPDDVRELAAALEEAE